MKGVAWASENKNQDLTQELQFKHTELLHCFSFYWETFQVLENTGTKLKKKKKKSFQCFKKTNPQNTHK